MIPKQGVLLIDGIAVRSVERTGFGFVSAKANLKFIKKKGGVT